jgi:hypothetical protein
MSYTTEVRPLSRLRGRAGVGVVPQKPLVERTGLPPPATLRRAIARPSAIAEAQLRRSYLRTAADGGLCSPASGRGERNLRSSRLNSPRQTLAAGLERPRIDARFPDGERAQTIGESEHATHKGAPPKTPANAAVPAARDQPRHRNRAGGIPRGRAALAQSRRPAPPDLHRPLARRRPRAIAVRLHRHLRLNRDGQRDHGDGEA